MAGSKPKSGLDNVLEGLSIVQGKQKAGNTSTPVRTSRTTSKRNNKVTRQRNNTITPLRDDTLISSPEDSDSVRSLRELRDVRQVQTGVKVPLDLHEHAENLAHDLRRQIDGRGVGAVYIALLERLRTDATLQAWVESYLRGEV